MERTGLTVQMGIACYYLADYTLARDHLHAALESARAHDYPQEAAQALFSLSQIANETEGKYEDARKHLEQALQLVRTHQPDSSLEARILYGLMSAGAFFQQVYDRTILSGDRERGVLNVKGKGEMTVYLLEGSV